MSGTLLKHQLSCFQGGQTAHKRDAQCTPKRGQDHPFEEELGFMAQTANASRRRNSFAKWQLEVDLTQPVQVLPEWAAPKPIV